MTFSPVACVGKVATPSCLASAAMRSWPGPIHWPPTSTTFPSPIRWLRVRPPTLSRASRTIAVRPASWTWRAAVSPARPAPTTITSASSSAMTGGAGRALGVVGVDRPATAAADEAGRLVAVVQVDGEVAAALVLLDAHGKRTGAGDEKRDGRRSRGGDGLGRGRSDFRL